MSKFIADVLLLFLGLICAGVGLSCIYRELRGKR